MKYLFIGDFNSETSETALKNFCGVYKLKNLNRESTCFKNLVNPSLIDLFLTNCSRSFQDTLVIETGLSDTRKMYKIVLKMYFTKQKHEIIFYRNYEKFEEALNRELMKHDVNNIDYEIIHEICAFNSQCTCTLKKEAPYSAETKRRNVYLKKTK